MLPLAQFSIANFSEGSFLNWSWWKEQVTRRYVEAKGRLQQTGCAHRTCLMGKLREEEKMILWSINSPQTGCVPKQSLGVSSPPEIKLNLFQKNSAVGLRSYNQNCIEIEK